MSIPRILCLCLALAACGRTGPIGRPPDLSPPGGEAEREALLGYLPPALPTSNAAPADPASLWSGSRESLFGDRRAMAQGDILTVVIEIDERAEISNSSARSRSGSEQMSVGALFGIPERVNEALPDGASLDPAVQLGSTSSASGDGSVRRNEKLTLRVAATVTGVLPNGVLSLTGSQEVRVNNELRELLVAGYVRPEDISRRNEVTYDKIAGARISYGGRGQITDMQQPRYGQQIADAVLPF